MSKKEYSAKEAAVLLLEKIKTKAANSLAKAEDGLSHSTGAPKPKVDKPADGHPKPDHSASGPKIQKTSPENKTTAEMAGLKVEQSTPPKATQKVISGKDNKDPIKLKKFLDGRKDKLNKAEKSKHDRCVEQVKEKSPDVKNPHAVCISVGAVPEKWGKNGS